MKLKRGNKKKKQEVIDYIKQLQNRRLSARKIRRKVKAKFDIDLDPEHKPIVKED